METLLQGVEQLMVCPNLPAGAVIAPAAAAAAAIIPATAALISALLLLLLLTHLLLCVPHLPVPLVSLNHVVAPRAVCCCYCCQTSAVSLLLPLLQVILC
jgi:hypothetical protein